MKHALAIAQQKEPTANIQTIFTVNSLLAAEAVAESPTPSTAMQIRAVGSCLHSIDNRVPGASAASVRVLRKVKGNLEEYLVKELEKRLTTEGISQEAGLVLALCGTPAAIVALSRHPSVWEKCLQYAGYVSSGFEKLLVRWIRDGDEEQSRHATDLLSDRLSSDRFTELMSFLSTLPMEKADYVARMLMKFIARNIEDLSEISLRDISTIAACVSRVQPPFTPNPEKGKYRHDFGEQFVNMAIAIRTAEPQCSESRIRSMLTDSIIWTTHRKTLICWLCASVILLVRTGVTSHVIALAAAIIAVLDISRREKFIGRQWRYFSWGGTQTEIALCLFMIGAAAASVSIQGSISLHGHNGQGPFYLLTIACLLLGIANNHLVYWPTTRLETKIFSIIKVCIWILLCFMIVTCAVTQLWTIDVVNMIRLIGSIYMIVLCVYVYRLRHSFIQTNYYLDAIEKES